MIRCNTTKEIYYGSTVNIRNRMYNHKNAPSRTIKPIIEEDNYEVFVLYEGDAYIDTENYFIINFSNGK